ncbi:hypothetical protein [Tessaracoccus sp. Z1128]
MIDPARRIVDDYVSALDPDEMRDFARRLFADEDAPDAGPAPITDEDRRRGDIVPDAARIPDRTDPTADMRGFTRALFGIHD